MTIEKINFVINLLILFFIIIIYCSFLRKEGFLKNENRKTNSFSNTVFDAFFGKEEKLSEEEKRDREILDMIERYDGKSVRSGIRKEE